MLSMPRRALLLTVLLIAPQLCAQSPPDALREVLARGRYQTELPGEAVRTDRGSPDERNRSRPRRPERDGEGGRPRDPGIEIGLATDEGWGFLLWILLGVVVLFAAMGLISTARNRHRNVRVRDAPAPPHPDRGASSVPADPLRDAEELARQGRYGEAIRLLLHRAIESLAQLRTVAPSWTSREILQRIPLPQPLLAPLHALVDAEERSLFARREPGDEDYEACAKHYRSLLAASMKSGTS